MRLKGLGLVDVLFACFHQQLVAQGYAARAGQMVDSTFVEVPRQCNTREGNCMEAGGRAPTVGA
ncbi:hypothetical protein [Methyloglobulus sp.]|uniref:hypothetical protein n=1 Tax=Methyloglobulus sp. TaxID=2518622 RepID=UPI00398A290C